MNYRWLVVGPALLFALFIAIHIFVPKPCLRWEHKNLFVDTYPQTGVIIIGNMIIPTVTTIEAHWEDHATCLERRP